MLAVARAMASSPRLLLVDEMSLGLAPLIVERLLTMLQALASATGCGILLVEQHVQQALAVADRGYVLNRGSVALEGCAEILRRETDLVESSYLGGTPTAASGS